MLKEAVKEHLLSRGYEVEDLGAYSESSVDYPEYGKKVAKYVVEGNAKYGIIICGTGIGISIAANKVKGARAALCHNVWTARLTREHNDANILAMGARVIGEGIALDMVDTFLTTEFEGGRHQNRIDKIED
jgi:ribose 5-phosphate isomerase B